MSILSRLFGGGSGETSGAQVETVEHEGFRILVDPIKESGGYRLAATIEKEVGGELRSHRMIRADVFNAEDEAKKFSLAKAKQMIDQQGDKLFG